MHRLCALVLACSGCAAADPSGSGDTSSPNPSSDDGVADGATSLTTASGTANTTNASSVSDSTTAPTTSSNTDDSSGAADTGSDDGTTGWVPPADCGGGALADLAASIEPGVFTQLATVGLDPALIDAGGGHHVLEYSDKGVWDPNTCQALFSGGGHLSEMKFIAFSASENTWFRPPNPTWWCPPDPDDAYACATHAYGHNALDPATGTYWFRTFNSAAVHRTAVASPIVGAWDEAPALPADAAGCIATALEYFPELGGLVYVDCAGQTARVLYDGDDAWTTLPGAYPMGPYHNYAVYSAGVGQVLFGAGNGSTALYLLDADGSANQIAAPPRQFHPSPDDPQVFRILTADPISGRFLAYAPAGVLYEYDAVSDTWTQVSDTVPADLQIAIPVSTYGVVLFLTREPSMWVYRHVAP
jgi:hypothetical protein